MLDTYGYDDKEIYHVLIVFRATVLLEIMVIGYPMDTIFYKIVTIGYHILII